MAWSEIAAALVGGAGGLINTLTGNEANRQMARYAFNKEVDMWNMQNEYNSPSAQMERYKAAGLNPNLIYDGGAASAGNATTLPRYSAPDLKSDYVPTNPIGMLSAYQDVQIKKAQADNVKAMTKINEAEAAYRREVLNNKLVESYNRGTLTGAQAYKLSAEVNSIFAPDWANAPDAYRSTWNAPTSKEAQTSFQKSFRESLIQKYGQASQRSELNSLDIINRQILNQIAEMSKRWYKFNQIKGLVGDVANLGGKFVTRGLYNRNNSPTLGDGTGGSIFDYTTNTSR